MFEPILCQTPQCRVVTLVIAVKSEWWWLISGCLYSTVTSAIIIMTLVGRCIPGAPLVLKIIISFRSTSRTWDNFFHVIDSYIAMLVQTSNRFALLDDNDITLREKTICSMSWYNLLRMRERKKAARKKTIFKCISLYENCCILIQMSINLDPKGPINN